MKKDLKIISIRYFNTRRGLGYECKTNIPNIYVWNDGDGGGTYISRINISDKYYNFTETELEKLIDNFEDVKKIKEIFGHEFRS